MTVVTETLPAVAAASQAIRTVIVFAARADLPALVAHRRVARVAAVFAVVTQTAVARVAGVGVLGRDRVSAGCAVDTVPVADVAIGRLLVVGPQDLTHEDEELADAAMLERSCDRGFAFAFAEGDPLHVRVRVAGCSFIRIKSCDRVRRLLAKFFDVQPDLELAEVEFFEHDPLSLHGNVPVLEIDFDLFELVRE